SLKTTVSPVGRTRVDGSLSLNFSNGLSVGVGFSGTSKSRGLRGGNGSLGGVGKRQPSVEISRPSLPSERTQGDSVSNRAARTVTRNGRSNAGHGLISNGRARSMLVISD